MDHPLQYYEKNSKSPTSHTVTSELSARDHYTFLGDVLLVEYIYSWYYYLFILQRIAFSFLTFSCETEMEFLRITFSFRSYGLRFQISFSVWGIWDSTTIEFLCDWKMFCILPIFIIDWNYCMVPGHTKCFEFFTDMNSKCWKGASRVFWGSGRYLCLWNHHE